MKQQHNKQQVHWRAPIKGRPQSGRLAPAQRSLLLLSLCALSAIAQVAQSSAEQDFEGIRLATSPARNEEPTTTAAGTERVTVIGPKSLRPNSDYNVLVSLAESQQPATIELQLIGARDSNRERSVSRSVLANSGETQTVTFKIGDWPSAEYVLSVSAQAVDRSWNFTAQERTLTFKAKQLSTLIQTDKAIYKPGQLVQFRAIFLSRDLRPVSIRDNSINVTVLDPKRNIVKQWLGLSNYRGLLSLDLQLSDDPMLGEWTIKVQAHPKGHQEEADTDEGTSKRFSVAEYILPTYEVSIELPPYATYNESDIVARVRATYTYGKAVRGHVTLTVQPLVRYQRLSTRPLNQAQYRARLDAGGSADIKVDLVKDLRLHKDGFEREIELFALVEEDLTGRKYNRTSSLTIYEKPIKIELLDTDRVYMPGLSKQIQLKVAYQDDTPVEDSGPPVELKFSTDSAYAAGKTLEIAKLQPIGGLVQHTLEAPLGFVGADSRVGQGHARGRGQQHINLEANYRGQRYYLAGLRARRTRSGHHLQISAPQLQSAGASRAARRRNSKQTGKYARPALNVNDDLTIRVQATEPLQQFSCQGLAGGHLIWALRPNAKNSSQHEFQVRLDQRMAPQLRVLCFYVRPAEDDSSGNSNSSSREMIADSLLVPVNGLAGGNSIKISASREEAKPNQEVEIGVQTKANALVGLLAIDQSVLALKTGNDITQKDIQDEAKLYDSSDGRDDNNNNDNHDDATITTADIFDSSDVIVITNNLIEDNYSDHPLMYAQMAPTMAGRVAETVWPVSSSSKIVLDSRVLGRQLEAPEFRLAKRAEAPLVIRSFFPETWIWENGTANSEGQLWLKRKAPDTITSWTLSAFSLDESTGFGVTTSPASLRVFRPFFIKLNLPYSIIRGETVNIQAVIFNYSKRPTSASVTLENRAGEFEFVAAANSVEEEERSGGASESRTVRIPAEDGVSVSFLIAPKKLGHIDIRMVARGELAADAVLRKLLVKAEGQTQHLNQAVLINLSKGGDDNGRGQPTTMTRNVSIEVPSNAVPGSQRVSVSAVGDLMGAGLSNPDELLRLPDGCGEQNMINLVPNVVILNYLEATKRVRSHQRARALRNIEAGYQRELNYKRQDGSFSAFGQSDANGSVWLTAYVLKTLQQARQHIVVDERVLERAANFIGGLAQSDGSIREVGMLHHKALSSSSGEAPNSIYLTAYSMIALMQRPIRAAPATTMAAGGGGDDDAAIASSSSAQTVALDEVLEKGLNYLESRLAEATSQDSPYDLAIITYALHLANRTGAADRAYEQLWLRAQQSRDMIWWQPRRDAADSVSRAAQPADLPELDGESSLLERESDGTGSSSSSRGAKLLQEAPPPPPLKPLPKNDKQSEHQFVPDSLEIEMTALALLSAVKRGGRELERAFPIVSWLISKQNSNGGFASTQDTVLAIEALAAFATAASSQGGAAVAGPSIDLDILYPLAAAGSKQQQSSRPTRIRQNNVEQLLIKPTNALVNQRLQLPDNTSWVQVQATGSGLAVVQVSWQYNLMVSAERPAFYLNPILDKTSNANYLQLSVCTFYKAAGESSNMALMEVELPSGYTADLEALPGLKRSPAVRRVDTSEGDTKVIIYLDKVTRDELCLTIPAHRSSKVSNNKPTPVSIYDYYDRQKAARIFYEPPQASSCDICDSDDCAARCPVRSVNTSARLRQQMVAVPSLHEQRKQNPFLQQQQQQLDSGRNRKGNDRLTDLSFLVPTTNSPPTQSDNETSILAPLERAWNATVSLVRSWG